MGDPRVAAPLSAVSDRSVDRISSHTGDVSTVLPVYAKKEADASFASKCGYDRLVRDTRVLIVEDILTTGGSVREVVSAVCRCGGDPVAVAALCKRGAVTADTLGITGKLLSLTSIDLSSWDEQACPLSRRCPINTDVGQGREFLARRESNANG